MSFSDADEFVKLPLLSVVAHVESGFHKLNRLTSLLKKAVAAEESYAKELQALVKDLPTQFNEGPASPVTVQTPSSLVMSAVVEIISKESQYHQSKAQQLNKLVVQPLRDLKDKGESVRRKMKDDGIALEKKNRELRDSLSSERSSCQKSFDSYKAETELPSQSTSTAQSSNATANTLKNRFGAAVGAVGGKKTVDLPTLHKQFVKYDSALTNAHETQRQLYDSESRLLREWQGMEEERLKAVKLYSTKFAELVSTTFVEPLASLTMNLDRTLSHFNASDDVRVSASACREQKAPREIQLVEYGLPMAPADVLNMEKASAANANAGSSSAVEAPNVTPLSPTAAANGPSVADRMKAMKLPAMSPSTSGGGLTSPKSTQSNSGSGLHSPSSTNFSASSSGSMSSGSSGGSDATLLKIYLPNDISYTLSAMQCPTVSFIKKKVIAKLERQGAEGLSSEKVQKAAIRVIGMGEDLEEKMPIAALISKASNYIQGKTLELEIVVAGLSAPSSSRPDLVSSSPGGSSSLLASASSPADDLSHATLERPKMVRPKKMKKKKRAVKVNSGFVAKFDANTDALTKLEEAVEENDKAGSDADSGNEAGGKDEEDA